MREGGQDVKFAFIDGHYTNRVSGEQIPHDEPIIIFRARDHHSLPLLKDYLSMITDDHHRAAVRDRIREFSAFAQRHPERMKEPGITRDIRLNDDDEVGATRYGQTVEFFDTTANIYKFNLKGDQDPKEEAKQHGTSNPRIVEIRALDGELLWKREESS